MFLRQLLLLLLFNFSIFSAQNSQLFSLDYFDNFNYFFDDNCDFPSEVEKIIEKLNEAYNSKDYRNFVALVDQVFFVFKNCKYYGTHEEVEPYFEDLMFQAYWMQIIVEKVDIEGPAKVKIYYKFDVIWKGSDPKPSASAKGIMIIKKISNRWRIMEMKEDCLAAPE